MHVKYWLVICLLPVISFCSAPQRIQKADALMISDQLNLSGNATNKILFLTFSVRQPDSTKEKYVFQLINKVFADGELKKNYFSQQPVIEPYAYYYAVSNDANDKEQLIKIADPLLMSLEYTEEDGVFRKIQVKKDSGQMTIRFQWSRYAKYISVYKPHPYSLTLEKIYNATL